MTLIVGLLVGFLLGVCITAGAWNHDEKRAVRRGFMEVNDTVYRLTPVNLRGFKEDLR